MRKIAFLLFFVLIVALGLHFLSKTPTTVGSRLRDDIDTARLQHLVYWAGLIDEYHGRSGHYPLQDWLQAGDEARLVRILHSGQLVYVSQPSDKYVAVADVNPGQGTPEVSMKDFVATLEAGLQRNIDEKYDIQQAPTTRPIGYYYLVTPKGYMLWATCIRCADTPIASLMADGITPVVTVASMGMLDRADKAKTRQELEQDETFKTFAHAPYYKESYVRALERKRVHDSKK